MNSEMMSSYREVNKWKNDYHFSQTEQVENSEVISRK